MIAARQALTDPDTAAHLRHARPRIERLLGLLAYRYGARKSRYIGSDKATLQASWAAALVNLNPIGRQTRDDGPIEPAAKAPKRRPGSGQPRQITRSQTPRRPAPRQARRPGPQNRTSAERPLSLAMSAQTDFFRGLLDLV